ncbi:MAG: A24 family peptidase [Nitrospinaceae bacterium]|jgi:leader peptidase (prepilin peptidase)/N-methyltransferase|nr:A24 family peptidase [Nitrospinaceae bacterium]
MDILTALPLSLQVTVVLFLGLSFGSFANVCIHRLPRNESVMSPRSRCTTCNTPIAVRDNIPLFSYLLLKGRCRQCAAAIPIRYPVVEVVTALLILSGFVKFGVSWKFAIFCVVGPALVIITAIDIKHKRIPDIIILPGIVFGLAAGSYLVGLKDSSTGLLVGGGTFLLTSEVYYRIRGRVGMGGGDIKFIAAVGALLGWQQVLLVIFLSALAGSLVGLVGLATKKINVMSQIPFGPFLAGGTLVAYFSGERIVYLYVMTVTGGY